jgi:hypothetical protein
VKHKPLRAKQHRETRDRNANPPRAHMERTDLQFPLNNRQESHMTS